jgi:hypothetical protein
MRTAKLALLGLGVLLAAGCGGGIEPDLEADLGVARANLNTDAGAKYDVNFRRYFATEGMKRSIGVCRAQHADLQGKYEGVFRFAPDGTYHLYMRPDDDLAECFVKIWETQEPPKPPGLPYLQLFEFDATGAPQAR